MQSQQPAPELRHRDSWEYYSTDDEHDVPKPRTNPSSTANPNPPAYGGPTQTALPASLRVGGGPRPPATDFEHITQDEADAGPQDRNPQRADDIPSALRPGGGARSETNPFLRKKIPENPATQIPPPTESLARMGLGESEANPWTRPVPKTQATESSSVYSQPSGNLHDGSDAFVVDPSRPPIPTIQPVLEPAEDYHPQQSFIQSPLEIQENPWSSNTTNIPLPTPPQALKPTPTGSNNPFLSSPQTTGQTSLQPSPAPVLGDTDPFAATTPSNYSTPPPQLPPIPSPSPALMSVPSDDDVDASTGGLEKKGNAPANGPPVPQPPSHVYPDDDNIWDDLGSLDKGKGKAVEPAANREPVPTDDWNLIDIDSSSSSAALAQSSKDAPREENQQPQLPPQQSGEASRWTPPRPPVDGKAETYEVKKIRWHDVNAPENPRTSPILVQNENGPCPLVALVNALSMTTPTNADEASLVAVLRSREQISLNLLLDAVFEELMSPRRTDEDVTLPDVSELYAFLQSLHTGMNVNPRYVPTEEIREAYKHTSLTQLDSADRDQLVPGTFENTHEMGLYAAFKIPLIHGWLAPNSEPTYGALERHANSYEDAQNLLFREEELDNKLSSPDGLTLDEQQLYQDLVTIKHFLSESATQLTAWGIQVISKAMKPGGFAILFRNDHFSTVYCHPQTKQLVALVTDYGYRTHEEVVWESLVDINGERTQYLSGDFRVVGSSEGSTSFGGYSQEHGGEWATVDNRRGRPRQQSQQQPQPQQSTQQTADEPPLSAAEQEDRDLALALQLQEEEDQRHREEVARRQREQDLSNRVIEQQGRQPYGQIPGIRNVSGPTLSGPLSGQTTGIAPARRSSASIQSNSIHLTPTPQQPPRQQPQRSPTTQQVRPLVPPRRNLPPRQREEGADAPPPYEQAAQDEPYIPPPGHPNHPGSSPAVSRQTTATSARNVPATPARQGQRVSGQTAGPGLRPTGSNSSGRDCIVM